METVFAVLHVVAAVFLVGPMAVLPMTALRAVRSGNAPVVQLLATSTRVFTLGSILVAVLGFALLGVLGQKEDVSVGTGWVLTSIVLYVIALVLSLLVVVPALKRAGSELAGGRSASALYGRIASSSGIVSLLLIAVVVLMVWRP
jgi:uncharacterized membrane protein